MGVEQSIKVINKLEDILHDLKSISLTDVEFLLTNYVHYFENNTKFKIGDKIRLTKTPVINSEIRYGCIGSKDFLIKGAIGKVKNIDCTSKGTALYGILFYDNQHTYSFDEDYLEKILE